MLAHPLGRGVPILLLTGDDALFERHRSTVAARIKSNFRKSTLLSGIHNAMNRGVRSAEPVGNKVLCIDDDPEILMFMSRCLAAEGYETETCSSGDQETGESRWMGRIRRARFTSTGPSAWDRGSTGPM